MFKKVSHIAVAVNSIEKARERFDLLFGKPSGVETVESQKVKVCFYEVGGVRIELVQPTSEDSAVGKFLASRGEGIHHIAFEVEGIQTVLDRLGEMRFELIDKKPRVGAEGRHVAFLHPASTHKVLIELTEEKKG
ncbi:MAG: methylmalonyl-CoA epimerase [Planctomycetota bacterium]|nr:methylmalonyl-CoA epimerase [Planctomycetota bacterium]